MSFSLYEILWYFCIYSFLGWCLEVVFCSVNTGHWVNRGFLNGPVCPIYGFGMVIVLLCLTPLADNLLILFIGSFFLTSILELLTGFILEKAFHAKWWDYTDQPFNIGGYICLKFSLAWGLGGMAAVKLLHPPIGAIVHLLPRPVGWSLLGMIFILFAIDSAVTLATLIGFRRDLREMDRIAAALRRSSTTLSRDLGTSAVAAEDKLTARRSDLENRYFFLRAHLLDRKLLGVSRLMKAFPDLKIPRHQNLLEMLRDDLHRLKKK